MAVLEVQHIQKTFEKTQKMMKKMQNGKGMKNMMKNLNPNDLKNFKI